jgi:hypothetical protein
MLRDDAALLNAVDTLSHQPLWVVPAPLEGLVLHA